MVSPFEQQASRSGGRSTIYTPLLERGEKACQQENVVIAAKAGLSTAELVIHLLLLRLSKIKMDCRFRGSDDMLGEAPRLRQSLAPSPLAPHFL